MITQYVIVQGNNKESVAMGALLTANIDGKENLGNLMAKNS